MPKFDYNLAFSRNIGLISEKEQETLKNKKVAIAGLGGVGGFHLLTLVRMGIENFHIADMDIFELQNFNRQIGARMSTIGEQKIEVLAKDALDINPNVKIKHFPEGVTAENMNDFTEGVDLYIDGLDFFVLDIRQKLFNAFLSQNIPCITAGPIGFSFAALIFTKESISFDDYFAFDLARNDNEKALLFLLGLTPKFSQQNHFADTSTINLNEKRGPSNVLACMGCSAIIASETIKILLGRGKLYKAPYSLQFDFLKMRFIKYKNRGGNHSLINKIKFLYMKKKLLE